METLLALSLAPLGSQKYVGMCLIVIHLQSHHGRDTTPLLRSTKSIKAGGRKFNFIVQEKRKFRGLFLQALEPLLVIVEVMLSGAVTHLIQEPSWRR